MLAAGPIAQPFFQCANLWSHDISAMVKHLLPSGLNFFAIRDCCDFRSIKAISIMMAVSVQLVVLAVVALTSTS